MTEQVVLQEDFMDESKNIRAVVCHKFLKRIPVNSYIIEGKNGKVILVDVGGHHTAEKHGKLLLEALGDRDVEYIIITHAHFDHYGNCKRFKSQHENMKNAKVVVHKFENEYMKNGIIAPGKAVYLGLKIVFGLEYVFKSVFTKDKLKYDEKVAIEGDIVVDFDENGKVSEGMPEKDEKNLLENYGVSLVWTPGHTKGSISVYNEEQKYIIVGDLVSEHLLSKGWGTHFLLYDQEAHLKTIKMICELDSDPENLLIFPAHVEQILSPKMLMEKFELK